MTKTLMAGIDLHSNNLMIGIDGMGRDGGSGTRELECDLKEILKFLRPYQRRLKSLAVESTYNWYWLVDGLRAAGYPVVLANPAKIDQYSGIKHADDRNDAYFLAELQRLNILPTGYIYDAALRPVRDLLRRRVSLVQQRTALVLSFKSLYTRMTGQTMSLSRVKRMAAESARELYEHPADQLIATLQQEHIAGLNRSIGAIEKLVLASAKALPGYAFEPAAGGGADLGDDDCVGSGRDWKICRSGTVCQLLPDGGLAADQQWEGQRPQQWQMRQRLSGVGVCGGGEFCQAL